MTNSHRTVCMVQARTGSTRLPAKVLRDLAGQPMLARVIHRLARATTLDDVWVATTRETADDALAELCTVRGWPYYRGSELDVLDRYYQTALNSEADIVVRVTSDCPLIDPDVVDQVVSALVDGVIYSSNVMPRRTFPRGLDVEAFRREALETAWREALTASEREHVTPFIWQQPDRFPQYNLVAPTDQSRQRWTVDTEEDYSLVKHIYDHFGHDEFGWAEVLSLLDQHPAWVQLNQHIEQKKL